jgi:hypothetical protein
MNRLPSPYPAAVLADRRIDQRAPQRAQTAKRAGVV